MNGYAPEQASAAQPATAYVQTPSLGYEAQPTYVQQTTETCDPAGNLYVAQPYTGDEIRTVFITGFPEDVKERELNNMLRFLPGYQASQMNWKNGQAQGFALFNHPQAARSAIDALQSLCFDQASVLRSELARKNMYLRDDYLNKRPRLTGGDGADQQSTNPKPSRENNPCNTLFIGNLSESVSKQELEGLVAHHKGFLQMKVVRAPRGVNCFIEFEDVPTATAVRDQLQGAVLASSDKGAVRVEFSKNPLGKKRDKNGQLIDHSKSYQSRYLSPDQGQVKSSDQQPTGSSLLAGTNAQEQVSGVKIEDYVTKFLLA